MRSHRADVSRWLAAWAVVLAFVANACGLELPDTKPTTTTTSAPARTTVATYENAPCPTVAGSVLGPDFECGYLTVPQSHAEPSGKKIKLPVAVLKTRSPNAQPDPVVYLAGGPGATPLVHNFDNWRLDRDLILLGQRGTLQGDPFLGCPGYEQFLAEAVGIGAEDGAYAAKSRTVVRDCRGWLTSQGVDLGYYDSTESATDVADLRLAMGIDQWNIYGLSYGTDLALQVVRNHPEGIRSVVLDSVLSPQDNFVKSGWVWAAQSLTAIFDACAAESACAAAYPDLDDEFTRMVNELSARPIRVTVDVGGRPTEVAIDGYKLASGVVVAAALTPGQLVRVPDMIHKLATGDPADAAKALAALPPAGITSYGLQFSVACSEWSSRTKPAETLADGKRALPRFPDAVLSLPVRAPAVFTDCEQWNVPAEPPSVAAPVSSDVPVLMASGSFDTATPPQLAANAATTLPKAKHLVFPGTGHEVALNTPDAANCFLEIMRNFYRNPTEYNTDCVATLKVPPFITSEPRPPLGREIGIAEPPG